MFRTILAAHDGSQAADPALLFAAVLAKLSQAWVIVIRVIETMRPFYDPVRGEVVWLSEEEPRLEAGAEELLAEQLAELTTHGISPRPLVRLGRPEEALVAEAQNWPDPVLVLASHGRGGLGRAVLGSVADHVLRSAPCPVAIVRSGGPVPQHFEHILVPLDGSAAAERALPYALWLAQRAHAYLTLVRVAETHRELLVTWRGQPIAVAARERMAQLEREAQNYLEAVRARLPASLSIHLVSPSGDPKRQLLRIVERIQPDLVVLTTHGRSGLRRWVLGSVTERLLTASRVPLLVIPSWAAQEEPFNRGI